MHNNISLERAGRLGEGQTTRQSSIRWGLANNRHHAGTATDFSCRHHNYHSLNIWDKKNNSVSPLSWVRPSRWSTVTKLEIVPINIWVSNYSSEGFLAVIDSNGQAMIENDRFRFRFYWLLGFWHFQPVPGPAVKMLIFFITAVGGRLPDNANDGDGPQGSLLVLASWRGSCYRYWAGDTRTMDQPGIIVPTLSTSTDWPRGRHAPSDWGRRHLVRVTFNVGCWEKHSGCSRRFIMVPL